MHDQPGDDATDDTTTADGHDAEVGSDTSGDDDDEYILLEAYDLDGDGDVSPIEEVRGHLGTIDARLEQLADEGGVTGAIADAVHHVVDKLDND